MSAGARPAAAQTAPGRPWREAASWLALLGPFFFASYGFANWVSGQRSDVGAIVFGWERAIPFVPWTIVPYWVIDVFYAISLFTCRTRAELRTHVARLFSIQLLSVACFLAFPLRFTFERPAVSGVYGWLFDVLMGFDRPFNQLPSLHISLLWILSLRYAAVLPRRALPLLHALGALIAVSVLTTYQHHFIDVPTGLWVGALCVWLFPDEAGLRPRGVLSADPRRRGLARRYGAAALGLGAASLGLGGGALWGLWLAASLGFVALCYAVLGAPGFQKRADGRMTPSALLLFGPYLLGAWLNSRCWTHKRPQADEVSEGIWLGRFPSARDHARLALRSWLDLTAELPARPLRTQYRSLPLLDLVLPSELELERAAQALGELEALRPTLVSCALGYSRSALVVAAWSLASGRTDDPEQALAWVERARPGVVLGPLHRVRLREWYAARKLGAAGPWPAA